MRIIISVSKYILVFALLTAYTQIGGLIYLLYKPLGLLIKKRFAKGKAYVLRIISFAMIYLIISLAVTPTLAKQWGRVPLPIIENRNLKAANFTIWLANRHYVKPELLDLLKSTSSELPHGATIIYLDANFPFIDGFPMTGHLSHDDGEKVDLAFIYSNQDSKFLNRTKSFSGYGIHEGPRPNEFDQPKKCKDSGYWQYSFLSNFTLPERYTDYDFDEKANWQLLKSLATHPSTGKIFIEPHLETRLRLTRYSKIRFHGCHAARHDDHIHLQL